MVIKITTELTETTEFFLFLKNVLCELCVFCGDLFRQTSWRFGF